MTRPSAAPVDPARSPTHAPARTRRRALAVLAVLTAVGLLAWWAPWRDPALRTKAFHEPDAGVAGVDASAPALHGARVVEGMVQDDQAVALAGALLRVSSLEAPTLPARELRSDARGAFRFADLPAEPLLVEVSRAGHEAKEYTLDARDGARLTLVLARQGELRVTLRDSPGIAVDGTEIVVTGPGIWPAQAARSDDKGEHIFKGLPAGDYRVRARRAARVALPDETVSVVPGQRTETELTLIDGAILSGVVLDQQTRKPLPGARVSIQDLTPGIDAQTIVANQSGAFVARGLWPGSARVDAQHDGYASASRDLTLPRGERLELLLAGAASISGHVVDEAGKPIAFARLSVSTDDGLPVELEGAGRAGDGTGVGELGVTSGPVPELPVLASSEFALGTLASESDANGAFRIERLAPASLALHVARPGYVPERMVISELQPHAEKRDLKVVLREAGRVVGRVLDVRGHALSSVYVAARAGDREQSAVTGMDGSYTLRDLLGEVLVEAQPDGRTTLRCKVVVKPRSDARCDLTADTAVHELSVRVVDEYGIGLEGAQVTVGASTPSSAGAVAPRPSTQLTRRDGSALLRELPAPPYLLDVALDGYLGVDDRPVAAAEPELRIAMKRSATLAGFVVDVLGRVVPGAFVGTLEGEASTETDAQGTFTLTGVAPGTQSLIAHHPQAGDGRSAEVRARPSERLDGVRVALKGRFSAEDVGDAGRDLRSERTVRAPYALEQRGRVLVVTQVLQPGPAAKAGLRVGDVLSAVDGELPLSAAHARGLLRTPAGRTAIVRVLRNRRAVNLQYRRPAL